MTQQTYDKTIAALEELLSSQEESIRIQAARELLHLYRENGLKAETSA